MIAGRMALDPWLGHQHNRHLVFLPTVMLVAWFGGLRAGIVSAIISTLALGIFWTDRPPPLMHVPGSDLVLFLLVSIAVSALIGSLQIARARADAAKDSREHVLEVVAHDLRSPLSAIKLNADALRRGIVDPATQARGLDRIDRSVAHMETLIRDLVDSTRIEQGDFSVTIREEAVEPIMRETIDSFAALARRKDVRLEIVAGAAGALVACDRDRVVQALGNLVGNALKFTPERGLITLRTREQDHTVRFEVQDNGPGISVANAAHVFDRYWKLDHKGTGLGLFIARNIVVAHGGLIWLETKLGVGTTFFFTLPRKVKEKPAGRARLNVGRPA